MPETTPRYVITHISGADGLRRLTFAQQGRHTHGSRDEANKVLRAARSTGLRRVLSPAELATLEVRAVACYAGHHDPVAYYCDRFEVVGSAVQRDGVPFMDIRSEEFRDSEYGHRHVEVDALRHWICDKLNALSASDLVEITRKHMES